jgi:integrase
VLAKETVALYRQACNRLEPQLGHICLWDVRVPDVQSALDAIHGKRGEKIGHNSYMHCKVTCSVIFAHAMRLGHHPGPNPEDGTSVRGYGHTNHRENGAYTLDEIKGFLSLFPAGPLAVAIGVNAFLALRKPEAQALLPDDYDAKKGKIRIHRDTKTGNDEWLPVVAPLAKLLSDGWEQISLARAECEIRKRIKGTNLVWKGWYGFRRGLATNLCRCGIRPEQACLILRNSAEVVRAHYIRLEQEGTKREQRLTPWPAWSKLLTSV